MARELAGRARVVDDFELDSYASVPTLSRPAYQRITARSIRWVRSRPCDFQARLGG